MRCDTTLFLLARSEGSFRLPTGFNIDGYSVPLNDVALLVAERSSANQEPAVFPVSPKQTHFVFEDFPRDRVFEPLSGDIWSIFGMNYAHRIVNFLLQS